MMLTRGNDASAFSKHLSLFIENLCLKDQLQDEPHIIQDLLKDVTCILKGIIVKILHKCYLIVFIR